jgi:hypothetical protein
VATGEWRGQSSACGARAKVWWLHGAHASHVPVGFLAHETGGCMNHTLHKMVWCVDITSQNVGGCMGDVAGA